jgi:glycosyltransferase involved in cell wall biosynthesis
VTKGGEDLPLRPQVDVILPFHKVDDFLKSAIKSVLVSDDVDISLILIDDRESPQDDLASELGSILGGFKFKVIVNSNHGYGSSLNLGLQATSSEYVALMNSDDLISPKRIKRQIQVLRDTNSDAVVCGIQKFYRNHYIPSLAGVPNLNVYHPLFLLLGAYGADATLLGKLEIMQRLKFVESAITCDWLTALGEYPKLRISGIHERLYFYRYHRDQATQNRVYKSSAFADIYPYWRTYSDSLGLPPIGIHTAAAISLPSFALEGDPVDIGEMNHWFSSFLKLLNGKQRREAKKLIARRLVVQSFIKKKMNWRISTLFVMGWELLTLRIYGIKPR